MPRTGQKGDMAAISPARPPRPPEAKFKRLHARDRAVTLQQKESRLPVRAGASMPQVTCTKVVLGSYRCTGTIRVLEFYMPALCRVASFVGTPAVRSCASAKQSVALRQPRLRLAGHHGAALVMPPASQTPLLWPAELLGRPLAFDIGFFNGRDTLEFLRTGHRVLAIEANPELFRRGRNAFAGFIRSGQLRLINGLLSDGDDAVGTRSFYVHHKHADWSSLVRAVGCRKSEAEKHIVDETACSRMELPLLSCRALLRDHGVPYVMKLDIEGHEAACLRPLPDVAERGNLGLALPQYLSMEYDASKLKLLPWLHGLGYQRAKLLDQRPFMDWSGPYGEAALDVETGAGWHRLAGWQPGRCPTWCDMHFSLGPHARAPTQAWKPLNMSSVRAEAKLLDATVNDIHHRRLRPPAPLPV